MDTSKNKLLDTVSVTMKIINVTHTDYQTAWWWCMCVWVCVGVQLRQKLAGCIIHTAKQHVRLLFKERAEGMS